MKKRILFFSLIISVLIAFAFIGCSNVPEYKVEFYDGDKLLTTLGTTNPSLDIPEAPEKPGYDFDGWYFDNGKWSEPLTATKLTDIPNKGGESVKIYARYIQRELPLSLDGFDFVDGKFQTTVRHAVTLFDFETVADTDGNEWVLYDSKISPLRNTAVELAPGDNAFYISVLLGEAHTSYAVVVRRKPVYAVSFDTDGGSPISPLAVEEGEKPYLDGIVPQKQGYTFSQWTGQTAEAVTEPITLTAVYEPNSYTVKLDADEGVLSSYTVTAVYDSPISLPTPQKAGYTFSGWYSGERLFDKVVYDTAEDINLKAKYSPITYDISYELNKGQNDVDNAVSFTVESDDIALAPATRVGATFDGWYTDAYYHDKAESIPHGSIGNVTLYAKWYLIDYTITYHCNGGDFGTETQTYNVENDFTLERAQRVDYTFSGWYLNEQLSGEKTERIALGTTGNMNLYAKWQYGTEGLEYTADGDDYTVTGYNGTAKNVIIPASMDGRAVTAVQSYAFATNETITHVTFENGIQKIGYDAFWRTPLQSVVIPASVTEIERSAFSSSNLTTVYYNAVNIKDIELYESIFGGSFDITIGRDVTRLPANFLPGSSVKSITFEEGGALTSIGERAFSNVGGDTLTLPATVKTIDRRAFWNCRYSKIILPDGLKTIGEQAFNGCLYMSELTIPASVSTVGVSILTDSPSVIVYVVAASAGTYWQDKWNSSRNIVVYDCLNNDVAEDGKIYTYYDGCLYGIADGSAILVNLPKGTVDVDVPDTISFETVTGNTITANVTDIAEGVFKGSAITSVVLPTSVTEIADNMFSYCQSLTEVTARGKITKIGAYAFDSCIKLATLNGFSDLTSLDSFSFYRCEALTTVDFPKLTVVAWNAFSYCKKLESVTLSPALAEIEGDAFERCSALKEFTFPATLTKIGYSAFEYTGLTEVVLPEGISSIGHAVFKGTKLTSFTFPSDWTEIPDSTFSDTRLTKIVIPDAITTIGGSAFSDCVYLKEVTLHEGLTDIEYGAFRRCSSLNNIVLPNTLQTIKSYAFEDCTALTKIVIPASVTYVASGAFRGCKAMTAIILPETVTNLGDDVFGSRSDFSIFISETYFKSKFKFGYSKYNVFYNCTLSENGDYVVSIISNAFGSYNYLLESIAPPPRDGYTFGGWFLNPDDESTRVTSLSQLSSDTRVFAKWIANAD